MKLTTLCIATAAVGLMNSLVYGQSSETCYRANIDSFTPTTLNGNPAELTLEFGSTTLLSGPDIGVTSGSINFQIFGGDGLTASYDGSNGSVIVNGFVAGNFAPDAAGNLGSGDVSIKDEIKGITNPYVCSTDLKTWTMTVDSELNSKIAEFEKAKQQIYFGTSKDSLQQLNFSDKTRDEKGNVIYRISGEQLAKIEKPQGAILYSSADGGRTLTELTSLEKTSVVTEFYDFDFCVCGELVPEPSSVTLLGLGGLAFVLRRRRK